MAAYSRRRVLQGLGAGISVAAAGCVGSESQEDTDGLDSGIPTPEEDGTTPSYTPLGFVEAEKDLEDYNGRLVEIEGWLQYDDNQQWWDDDGNTRWLETYDLFGTDPRDADDPERFGSVTVVDDGSLEGLPDSVYVEGDPVQARIQGRADILFPELGGPGQYGSRNKEAQQRGEPLVKAHTLEPLDADS